MSRVPVYIAGPYAGSAPEIHVNVRRAVALGHLAAMTGYAPIVPHAIGAAGVYGDPSEAADGVRKRSVESGCAHAEMVGRVGGEFWLIQRPDGTPSAGCASELTAFMYARADVEAGKGSKALASQVHASTWLGWRSRFLAAGLADLWDRSP